MANYSEWNQALIDYFTKGVPQASAIPIVGSMSFDQTKSASSAQSDRSANFPSTTPENINQSTLDSGLVK